MNQAENLQAAPVLETRELTIAGMGCDNCVKKLERAFRAKAGVKEASVDGIAGRAKVTFDPAVTNLAELHEVVAKSGYRAGAVA